MWNILIHCRQNADNFNITRSIAVTTGLQTVKIIVLQHPRM
jgi:hypothetical protein